MQNITRKQSSSTKSRSNTVLSVTPTSIHLDVTPSGLSRGKDDPWKTSFRRYALRMLSWRRLLFTILKTHILAPSKSSMSPPALLGPAIVQMVTFTLSSTVEIPSTQPFS
ncbi:unnamed protein product [Ixodes pacificus]